MQIQGQGFSFWGGIDLYVWHPSYTWGDGSFAGTVHTTAHRSALTLRLPVVATKQGQYCSHLSAIYVVAIDDDTHLSSGVQKLLFTRALGCYALKLPPVTAKPSLQDALNATKGAIHVSGHHYTPHTSIAVYLLRNDLPLPALSPTTRTATGGGKFTTVLHTGYTGCSDTLSWTTFALDQAANVASPLRRANLPCHVFKG